MILKTNNLRIIRMNDIEIEIQELKKRLDELEKQQKKNKKQELSEKDLLNGDCNECNMIINIYCYEDDTEKQFKTFNELFDFLEKKKNKTDLICLDYCQSYKESKWINKDYNDFSIVNRNKIVQDLSELDAIMIHNMDFGIINRKNQWKYNIYIQTPTVNKYKEVVEDKNHHGMSEKEYWNFIEECKKWRLF
jgi:hypothetical protein